MVDRNSTLILLIVAIALVNAVEKPSFLSHLNLPEQYAPVGFNPASGKCSVRMKEHCQREFSKALGAPDTIFRDIDTLKKYLDPYYMNEKLEKGLLTLCVHRANLYRCMGRNYDTCTDPFVIFNEAKEASQPMSLTNAFEYSSVYKTLEFDCLGGQIQATANYQCVLQTWKSDKYKQDMQKCQDALNKADYKNFCEAAQTFLDCVGALFKTNTCPTPELSWWECERNRVGFSIDGFCPKLTCNKVISVKTKNEDDAVPGVDEKSTRRVKRGSFVSEKRLALYKQFAYVHPRRTFLDNAKLHMKK